MRREVRSGRTSDAAARCCPRDAKQQTHAKGLDLRLVENLDGTPRQTAIDAALDANSRGVSALPGSFASSRARLLDSPRRRPRLSAASMRGSLSGDVSLSDGTITVVSRGEGGWSPVL